ncbi:putative nucleoside triphosphate pyrophosphohydrolase [Rhizobium phage vB_RglS_P106B]|uniref:Putative nucleoside triphosphate pyrophosphohydrolase n=1 Tax=Rhizobium phage vB_RglS_P106B TaxID=1458697 RepID=W6E8I3_9CAUD|nr:MazG-like pyrophosphatase [Rhizobium phage vB_RglS_P106B]AHJ10750.1 putative nucleoside triphosphate pyrophosphohydrolase [Rhizobium phage vB_RglS_P106B]
MIGTIADKVRMIILLNCTDNRMERVFLAEKLSALGANVPVIMVAIEKEFNIDLDDEFAKHWETVADVIRDVENMVPWQEPVAIPAAAAPQQQKPVINRIAREDVEVFARRAGKPNFNLIDEYQRIAVQSAIYPGKGTPFGLMYVALGLAEAGEVQNKVKKAFRDDNVIDFENYYGGNGVHRATVRFNPITPERRKQIVKEMGGVFWYLAANCDELGITMSEVALANLDELCGRGERDTLRGDGDNR